jgi:urea transport system ATP-binding protein
MLEIKDLTLKYGQSQILHGVDLNAAGGEVMTVMGTNGVGKTSLLKAISGRHPYVGGTMMLDGKPLEHPSAFDAARAGIAYVPQGREVFPMMTVRENLQAGFACLPKAEHVIPDHIFDLFPGLKEMIERRGGDLSGGPQQQLAIARALITRPKVLLLDEPTAGMARADTNNTIDLLKQISDERDITIAIIEHDMQVVFSLAQRITVLAQGTTLVEDTPDNIKGHPKVREAYLGETQAV